MVLGHGYDPGVVEDCLRERSQMVAVALLIDDRREISLSVLLGAGVPFGSWASAQKCA